MDGQGRFEALWQRLGARGDALAAYARLCRCYGEPHRAYHTLDHVFACLDAVDPHLGPAACPDAVETALWFHDAVYDPRAADNEQRSATLAAEVMAGAGLPEALAARVSGLILATRHETPPPDLDAGLVVDADLSVLGCDPKTYADYARKIRAEYAWVSEPAYRAGRARVLRRFLDRRFVYATDPFRRDLEAHARRNMEDELGRLATPQ